MKKRNEDGYSCMKCFHYNGTAGCFDSLKSGTEDYSVGMCSTDRWRFYANRQETERLLNLWDDANGSIDEWRENDRPMMKHGGRCCTTCLWSNSEVSCSLSCKGMEIKDCSVRYHRYYANKPQTETLLKWHDDRYGKIGERLMDVDEKLDSLKVYDEKEKAVEDLDFRVGDDVFSTSHGNGCIVELRDYKPMIEDYPIKAHFYKDVDVWYSPGGLRIDEDCRRELYHGHNLKVTVEEKKPVRYDTVFEFVMQETSTGELKIHREKEKNPGRPVGPIGWECVYGPVKVQIPK